MPIKAALRKVYSLFFETSEGYIKRLRKLGVQIGDDCTFYYPDRCVVDTTAPHLLTMGDHVKITGPATILTHDYSWSVIKGKTGEIFGNQKAVTIGSNVFIGWGGTVLCGTTIEDNVIIGAHSVVSGRAEHDSVYAGIPAKRICSLEHYREKRAEAQLEEAQDYVVRFRRRFGRDPHAKEMREYFFLWVDPEHLNDASHFQMGLMGTYDKSMAVLATSRLFASYEEFLASCYDTKMD